MPAEQLCLINSQKKNKKERKSLIQNTAFLLDAKDTLLDLSTCLQVVVVVREVLLVKVKEAAPTTTLEDGILVRDKMSLICMFAHTEYFNQEPHSD